MKKVLVFGTFDGLHKGHEDFFRQAKACGDYLQERECSDKGHQHILTNERAPQICSAYLVVVVGRDSTVQRIKKKLPRIHEDERLEVVQKAPHVDFARLGNENVSPYIVIKEINPDVICLGYDQTDFTDKLVEKINEFGLKIAIKRMKAFHPEKYHSSI